MLFSSFPYLFAFLPIAAFGYDRLVARGWRRAGTLWLLAASLFFYLWGRPEQIVWLLASIGFNHVVDRALQATDDPRRRKRWLTLGLIANIVFLASLKYTSFLLSTLFALWHGVPPRLEMAFPLGVSFFTLQQIMYLVDRYEGLAEPSSLLEHATFVSLFATITSGPITRSKQIVPQLRSGGGAGAEQVARGLGLLAIGLCKKVIIADSFAQLAGTGAPGGSTLEAWVSSLAYSFQIYFDFSGYSDMAIASGLFMGLVIPENFLTPYRSRSVVEFWQRWHLTLSQFITTYLYTPLVRSKRKVTLTRASLATLLAMGIAGLWHGPSWTYVAFGLFHGVGLVVNQVWRKKIKKKLPSYLAWPATLIFVNAGFVFFRAANLHDACAVLRQLVSLHSLGGTDTLKTLFPTAGQAALILVPALTGCAAALLGPTAHQLVDRAQPQPRHAVAVASLFLLSLFFLNSSTAKEFIYRAF